MCIRDSHISTCQSNLLFFFKQKTAYEIGVRLVGSEMCIRDRLKSKQKQIRDNVPLCFRALEVAACLWHALSNDRSGAENEPVRVHSNLSKNKSEITFPFAFVR